jgi:hypothetical protein
MNIRKDYDHSDLHTLRESAWSQRKVLSSILSTGKESSEDIQARKPYILVVKSM